MPLSPASECFFPSPAIRCPSLRFHCYSSRLATSGFHLESLKQQKLVTGQNEIFASKVADSSRGISSYAHAHNVTTCCFVRAYRCRFLGEPVTARSRVLSLVTWPSARVIRRSFASKSSSGFFLLPIVGAGERKRVMRAHPRVQKNLFSACVCRLPRGDNFSGLASSVARRDPGSDSPGIECKALELINQSSIQLNANFTVNGPTEYAWLGAFFVLGSLDSLSSEKPNDNRKLMNKRK
jgi:hypothetical protein